MHVPVGCQKLKKVDLWPLEKRQEGYSDDDVFDLIELLSDHVSMPTEGRHHSYANCGWHYDQFDRETGRNEFRTAVNEILKDYQDGYELFPEGEILRRPGAPLAPLLEAQLPVVDPENVEQRVAAATRKFRSRHASNDDRRDSIRDLADVLEFLRPKLKGVLLSKDEQDLFSIVNNFGIRHHNQQQRIHYDKNIWFDWMFYFYLATIHAGARLLKGTT
jgi:hypothetical protein